jgi:hypothetical protein
MKRFLFTGAIMAMLTLAHASDGPQVPAPYVTLKGEYSLYSGELGDQQAPTRADRKISFIVEGKAAKDIFDAIAPDDKLTCSGNKGARSRTKGTMWCTYEPGEGYTCYFGFDLKTGKTIAGGIC